jgi:hypothetical protein
VAALAAVQSQEAVRRDAAPQERVGLVLDEPRQVGAGAGLGMGDEAIGVLLRQALQRGLLRSVALTVNRGAIGRPLRSSSSVGVLTSTNAGMPSASQRYTRSGTGQ